LALLLSQNQIDDPAATDVFAGLTAVVEDVGVGAAGFFEGVGKHRETVESTLVIDTLREFRDGAIVPCKPSGPQNCYGAKGIAKDVS
jgi:hypothetical protein